MSNATTKSVKNREKLKKLSVKVILSKLRNSQAVLNSLVEYI